jgi:hypothetical protein
MGMGVTYRDHCMSSVQVQIFLTFVIPNLASLSSHDIHVEQGINIE